jgi:hypothetical protein
LDFFPGPDFYVSEVAARQALREHGQFNILDGVTGWKADLIFRKAREFSREEFARRRMIDLHDIRLAGATVEDLMIAKLEWAKLGESSRQIEDVASMLRARIVEIDRAYVVNWVHKLRLDSQWGEACRIAGVEPTN